MSAKKVEGSSAPAIRRDLVLSGTHLDQKDPKITYSDDWFSTPDLGRSIPSMVDGLKPVQRKILFYAFKKNLVEEIIVSDFTHGVAQSAYYYRWQTLASTIVGMAHDYVGSNNINLLVPAGLFGTRLMGGKDGGKKKHLYTRLSPITRVLFPKDDDVVLNYLNEDGQIVEPTWYMPIIPTVLVNGSEAIGTGCTTFIPNYNPREILANIRRLLNGESMVPMDPWYRGFKGTIEKTASKEVGCTYTVTGLYEEVDDTCIRITELPIGKWTADYKEFVTSLPLLQDHRNYSNTVSVEFDLKLTKQNMAAARKEGFLKTFKLTTTISTSNMHLFDKEGVLKKYATPEQILEEFFELRLEYYKLRKKIRLENLKLELLKLDNKVRNKAEFVQELREKGFTALPKKATPVEAAVGGAIDDAAEESSMAPEPSSTAFVPGSEYDYLLEISNFISCEKSQEMLAERKKMNEAVAELESTTPKALWHRDLDALENELDKLDLNDAKAEEEMKAIKAKARASKGC
ncbi:DNA topoisomerase 2 [Cardamine amara subsp. amara]|uniref:DNA topoisomerase (ATP-hydrolyzing) n=1 Tax=Cardamine amara subsp. amara TaxID=228776 RepID=A0ABD0Z7N0_CARAN